MPLFENWGLCVSGCGWCCFGPGGDEGWAGQGWGRGMWAVLCFDELSPRRWFYESNRILAEFQRPPTNLLPDASTTAHLSKLKSNSREASRSNHACPRCSHICVAWRFLIDFLYTDLRKRGRTIRGPQLLKFLLLSNGCPGSSFQLTSH